MIGHSMPVMAQARLTHPEGMDYLSTVTVSAYALGPGLVCLEQADGGRSRRRLPHRNLQRGDIRVAISSTGTLSAISTVTVGSQVRPDHRGHGRFQRPREERRGAGHDRRLHLPGADRTGFGADRQRAGLAAAGAGRPAQRPAGLRAQGRPGPATAGEQERGRPGPRIAGTGAGAGEFGAGARSASRPPRPRPPGSTCSAR